MRIEDLEEGDEDAMTMTTSGLVDQLKRSNTIKAEDEETKGTIDQALSMHEFLKKTDF